MSAIDLGNATVASWTPGPTGATVVLTVTLPDGTTATPAVTESSGTYNATVTTSQAGRYFLKWSIAATSTVYTDLLDVWPADPRFIVPLDEMLTALRMTTQVSDRDRSDMRLFLAAATEVIEDIVGTVLIRTVTQVSDGGRNAINLWQAVAEEGDIVVTVNGSTLTEGVGFVVWRRAGIIYAGSSTSPTYFSSGRQNVSVTYPSGSSTIKPNVRLAAIELCRHMWQFGRQANQRAQLPGDLPTEDMAQTPAGFLIPRRVLQLLGPDARKLPA